jgi:hypothetical protein
VCFFLWANNRDTFCICFLCIYQMLVALFGWLPSYQFTFGCIRAFLFNPSSGPPAGPTTTVATANLFADKYMIDTWIYYICSAAVAVSLLALTESVRARVMLSPLLHRISQALMCCRSPESLKQPQASLVITDDDVRACAHA